jgi:hypothetical protein
VNESPGNLSGFGTMSLPKLKLIYLPVRARAEATRLALAYANIPYEDVTIPFSDWPEFKVCRYSSRLLTLFHSVTALMVYDIEPCRRVHNVCMGSFQSWRLMVR